MVFSWGFGLWPFGLCWYPVLLKGLVKFGTHSVVGTRPVRVFFWRGCFVLTEPSGHLVSILNLGTNSKMGPKLNLVPIRRDIWLHSRLVASVLTEILTPYLKQSFNENGNPILMPYSSSSDFLKPALFLGAR